MSNANIDEDEWVIHISGILNNGLQNDIKNPVCIFQVPKSVKDTKPEAYIPQVVALGPYHHFQPKTYHMQKSKINAALVARERLKLRKVPDMMNDISKILPDIRGSYHDNLGIKPETLSWIMLIDGLFLLSLIHKPENNHQTGETAHLKNDVLREAPNSIIETDPRGDALVREKYHHELETCQFEDSRERKHSLDAILKDVVLLENQIPKIALDSLLATETAEIACTPYDLKSELFVFCTSLSPVELYGNSIHRQMVDPHHVLDALHQLVWLGTGSYVPLELCKKGHLKSFGILKCSWTLLTQLNVGYISVIIAILDLILIILNTLGLSLPHDIFRDKEVLVPSASQLSSVGVKFYSRWDGGIRDIDFYQGNEVFLTGIPVLKANITSSKSEVVMRNLLAYEAEAMPESPKFSRYVELMSGLMQTIADVELLKGADIVPQDAYNTEVVKLFGSLKEVVGSNGTSDLDKTIESINAYYYGCRKVKIGRVAKRCLVVSWKILTVIALILAMGLLLLQTFCSIHKCPKIFKN